MNRKTYKGRLILSCPKCDSKYIQTGETSHQVAKVIEVFAKCLSCGFNRRAILNGR